MRFFIKKLCLFIYWLIGWKVVELSTKRYPKFMLIVAPHTSNWDFVVALVARYITPYGYNTKFLGKSSLFKPPFGFFFRWLGGIPVYRDRKNNMVEQVAKIYAEAEGEFGIAMSPEGTRKYIKDWKTGFYHIAVGAGVPIMPVGLDYSKKQVILFEAFFPTGNMEEDLPKLKTLFQNCIGYTPENYNYNV